MRGERGVWELKAKMRLAHQATSIEEQVSTNTGPRSAARYTNQFSHHNYLWLCSLVDKCLAVEGKVTGSISSRGDFFSLKFLFKRKLTKWWRTTTRTTQVIRPMAADKNEVASWWSVLKVRSNGLTLRMWTEKWFVSSIEIVVYT